MAYWIALWYARIPARLAHKKSGGQEAQALGRSRGGFSTKIHLTVDGLGLPLRFRLTGGERNDMTQAEALLTGLHFEYVIADRAYDADPLVTFIVQAGAVPVIPSRAKRHHPREHDTWLYRERHLVECLVNKLKHFRHLFSRFDKLARRFLGFLHFVGTLIWLR
jgi:transposase